MESLYITRKELAFLLRISLSTIDRNIRKCQPPYDKIIRVSSRCVRFHISILKEFEQLGFNLEMQDLPTHQEALDECRKKY
jgi:hypothetical protein